MSTQLRTMFNRHDLASQALKPSTAIRPTALC